MCVWFNFLAKKCQSHGKHVIKMYVFLKFEGQQEEERNMYQYCNVEWLGFLLLLIMQNPQNISHLMLNIAFFKTYIVTIINTVLWLPFLWVYTNMAVVTIIATTKNCRLLPLLTPNNLFWRSCCFTMSVVRFVNVKGKPLL